MVKTFLKNFDEILGQREMFISVHTYNTWAYSRDNTLERRDYFSLGGTKKPLESKFHGTNQIKSHYRIGHSEIKTGSVKIRFHLKH